MEFECLHINKTYERREEVNGISWNLYVCHDCQSSFYSDQSPVRDDQWHDDWSLFEEEEM